MVQRMVKRGFLLTPFVAALLFAFAGPDGAAAGAIGAGLALFNLWASGRVIGGVAENAVHLLLPAAMMMLIFALILVSVVGVVMTRTDALDFTITGIVFIGMHLTLVVWEAAGSLLKLPKSTDGTETPREKNVVVSDNSVRS